jgi:phage terminase small subunit
VGELDSGKKGQKFMFRVKGGGALTKSNVERFLLDNSDPNDALQLERVRRYIKLRALFDKLDKAIREHGEVIIVKNGKQNFVKINPAIQEKEKINSQLMALEREFQFILPSDEEPVESPPKTPVADEEESLI